jgi:heme exporter protein A
MAAQIAESAHLSPHAASAPAAGPALPVLQTTGLSGQRGERLLFEQLDFSLAPGSVTWLRGRNGRGKTTLLRLLADLASPESGTVVVLGRERRHLDAESRSGVLYSGHQNALKDDLGAAESLAFLMRLQGPAVPPSDIDAALKRLGVFHKRRAAVRTLSQGQRRRVALARLALSLATPLWLLDEPFDALDVDGIAVLNELLTEHAAAGGATLLTSHQPLSLQQPAPRVLDLDHSAAQGHVLTA